MELSAEERRKIYEEEKAKQEAGEKQQAAGDETATGLSRNAAGLLCYLGFWITGIIFLFLEPKDRFVRFHAFQSIVVFGMLTIASALLSWIPVAGIFFSSVIGVTVVILWIVLMIRAYQGVLFKVPIAGDIASSVLGAVDRQTGSAAAKEQRKSEAAAGGSAEKTAEASPLSAQEVGKRLEEYITRSRAGRVTGYSFSIFWNVVVLIFLTFFYKYVAWYSTAPDGGVTRTPLLTDEYTTWLPIFITATSLTIAGYVAMIIYDKYWFREAVQISMSIIGLVSVASLAAIFPFDFSIIPDATAVDVVPKVVTAVLIFIAVAMGATALVRTAKLIGLATNQEAG